MVGRTERDHLDEILELFRDNASGADEDDVGRSDRKLLGDVLEILDDDWGSENVDRVVDDVHLELLLTRFDLSALVSQLQGTDDITGQRGVPDLDGHGIPIDVPAPDVGDILVYPNLALPKSLGMSSVGICGHSIAVAADLCEDGLFRTMRFSSLNKDDRGTSPHILGNIKRHKPSFGFCERKRYKSSFIFKNTKLENKY